MDERLKERLVGASVLVALMVIFVPFLLEPNDDDQRPSPPVTTSPAVSQSAGGSPGSVAPGMPKTAPRMPSATNSEAASSSAQASNASGNRVTDTRSARAASSTPGASPKGAEKVAKAKPVIDSKPKQSRVSAKLAQPAEIVASKNGEWVVQLASFSQSANATKLRVELVKQGFPAFTRSGKSSAGAVTRVYVGPMGDASKAQALVDPLEKASRLRGIVVRRP